MKLIIDIPEEVYKAHKMGDVSPWIYNGISDAVKNGTPLEGYLHALKDCGFLLHSVDVLDKIRAEIINKSNEPSYLHEDEDWSVGLEMALEIIDKYKAESEGKE